jgi:signal transduction histidine kinase/DNA-binding NarL/FixJ family response regulator
MSLHLQSQLDSNFFLISVDEIFAIFNQIYTDDAVFILDYELNIKYINTKFLSFSADVLQAIPEVNQNIQEIKAFSPFLSYLSDYFTNGKKHLLFLQQNLYQLQVRKTYIKEQNYIYLFRIIFEKNCGLISRFDQLLRDISESSSIKQNIYSVHHLFDLLFPNQEFIYTFRRGDQIEVREFWRNPENELSRNFTCSNFFTKLGKDFPAKLKLNQINLSELNYNDDCLSNKAPDRYIKALIYRDYVADNDVRFMLFFGHTEIQETEKHLFENLSRLVITLFQKKQEELYLAHSVEKEEFVRRVTDFFLWEYHHSTQSIYLHYHDIKNLAQAIIHSKISLSDFLNFFIQNDSELFRIELDRIVQAEINLLNVEVQIKPNALFSSQYARFSAGRFFDKYQNENIIIGNFQDISMQKINEIKLEQAKFKAEESDKLKSSFLANMSHEIRTPLNGILGFSRLLSSPDLEPEKRNRYLDYINKSGQNLLYLINDILDVAKIESGKFSIKIKDCLVNEMLDELHQNFIHQLGARDKSNIELKLIKGVDDQDFAIKTDPLRLRQVFNNLIGNSLKFTEYGYIRYGYSMSKDMKYIHFFVEDTGIGIPADKIDIIFSRFGKIENGRIVNPGGTGLGLSIVKQIIEFLEGTINVHSIEGKGSRFDFKLKYRAGNKQKEIEDTQNFSLDKYQNIRMLVVEDNMINQQLILDTLMTSTKNLRITIAENGQIAIDKVNNENFDIILMDIQMPVMDGCQATEAIRAMTDPVKAGIPIIGLSAHAIKSEADKCMLLGMNSYLTKPFIPDVVLREIAKVLNNSKLKIAEKTDIIFAEPLKNRKMIDLSTLIQMYGDDKSKLKSILNLYAEQIPPLMKELDKNLVEKDWANSMINAHTLKGNLSYLGNDLLREYALEIEKNAKSNKDCSLARQSYQKLVNLWNIVYSEIIDFNTNE